VLRNTNWRINTVKGMQCRTPTAQADPAATTHKQERIARHIIVCSVTSGWWSIFNNIHKKNIHTYNHTYTHTCVGTCSWCDKLLRNEVTGEINPSGYYTYSTIRLNTKHCTVCPQIVPYCCHSPLEHQLIALLNRSTVCSLRGTNWILYRVWSVFVRAGTLQSV